MVFKTKSNMGTYYSLAYVKSISQDFSERFGPRVEGRRIQGQSQTVAAGLPQQSPRTGEPASRSLAWR